MYPYKTHHIDLPGNCNIAYMDEGKGDQTLLFIHGLANYAPVWKKNIDYLRQFYRCIAIDLPGNGLSAQHDYKFSMRFFADSVYNFIQALKLNDLCIVGHSMGGQVTMTTALLFPGCADKLVLCAPAGFEAFSALDKQLYYGTMHMSDFLGSEESILRQTIENSFYRGHTQGEGVIKELVEIMKTYKSGYYRKMVEACIKGMLEEPVNDNLHLIKQPTLILFGEQDALIPNRLLHHTTPKRMAEEGAKKIPNAVLQLLPECGHFIQWEKPEDVNRNIVLFLEGELHQ
jgi:pimeloyl-ACP methyl ester carboxylesterase